MRIGQTSKVAIVGALAGLAFALSLLHLAALLSGGELRAGTWRVAVVAAGYDRRAEQVLAAPRPSAGAVSQSKRLTELALSEFPYDTSAWLRLAYIDRLQNGRMSPRGIAAFTRSYDLVAVDPQFAAWRIHFALENWTKLPAKVKVMVRVEASALSTDAVGRDKITPALRSVRDPIGAALAFLWLQRYVAFPAQLEQNNINKLAERQRLLNN